MELHRHLLGRDLRLFRLPELWERQKLPGRARVHRASHPQDCKILWQLARWSLQRRQTAAAERKYSRVYATICNAANRQTVAATEADGSPPKRKRGRPRKIQVQLDSEPVAASSAPEDGAGTADATSTPALPQSQRQDAGRIEPSAVELSHKADAQALHGASQQSSKNTAIPLESTLGAAPIEPVQRKRRGRPSSKAISSRTQPVITPSPDQRTTNEEASKPGAVPRGASRDPLNALQEPSHRAGASSESSEGAAGGDENAAASMLDQQDESSTSPKHQTQSHPSNHHSSAQAQTHNNNSQEQQGSAASPRPPNAEDSSSTSSSSEASEEDDPWASLNGVPEPVTADAAAAHSSSQEGRAQPPGGIRLMDLSNLVPSRRIRGVLQTAERSWAATQAHTRASLSQAQQPTDHHSMSSQPSGAGSPDEATALTGMAVTWLGTSSGNPTIHRNVSCAVLRLPHSTFLVDCGEGTAKQILRAGLNAARIKAVMITHLHGDHIFGLAGVLQLISDQRAAAEAAAAKSAGAAAVPSKPLIIVGPPGLHMLLETLLLGTGLRLSMPIIGAQYVLDPSQAHPPEVKDTAGMVTFHWLPPSTPPLSISEGSGQQQGQQRRSHASGSPHEVPLIPGLSWRFPLGDGIFATSAQLQHRLPCWGYVLQETLPANGQPANAQGTMRAGRKVVLLGDTCGSEAIAGAAMNADLVSHEATFADGMEQKAHIAQHSTAAMAGAFARRVAARQLVLTHFSGRYVMAGGGRARRDGPEQEETEDSGRTINMLQYQASRTFGSKMILAAHDLFTLPIPLNPALQPTLHAPASPARLAEI